MEYLPGADAQGHRAEGAHPPARRGLAIAKGMCNWSRRRASGSRAAPRSKPRSDGQRGRKPRPHGLRIAVESGASSRGRDDPGPPSSRAQLLQARHRACERTCTRWGSSSTRCSRDGCPSTTTTRRGSFAHRPARRPDGRQPPSRPPSRAREDPDRAIAKDPEARFPRHPRSPTRFPRRRSGPRPVLAEVSVTAREDDQADGHPRGTSRSRRPSIRPRRCGSSCARPRARPPRSGARSSSRPETGELVSQILEGGAIAADPTAPGARDRGRSRRPARSSTWGRVQRPPNSTRAPTPDPAFTPSRSSPRRCGLLQARSSAWSRS